MPDELAAIIRLVDKVDETNCIQWERRKLFNFTFNNGVEMYENQPWATLAHFTRTVNIPVESDE